MLISVPLLAASVFHAIAVLSRLFFGPPLVVASSVFLSFSPFYILFVAAGRSFFSLLLFCFSSEFQGKVFANCLVGCAHNATGFQWEQSWQKYPPKHF